MSAGDPKSGSAGGQRSRGGWWVTVGVPLAAALVGALIGAATSVYVADRQLDQSRRDVDRQLAESSRQVARQVGAARAGRVSDSRAQTYADFVTAVDRHLAAVEDAPERSIRQADRDVFSRLRVVQLVGSARAYDAADAIAGRSRRITNAALVAIHRERSSRVSGPAFLAQQDALDSFVALVQPELRQ